MITKQSKEITHHSLLSLCYACVQKQTNPTTIYTTGCDIWLLKTRIKKTIFKKTTRRRRWLACDLALARASLRSKGKEGGAVAPALVQEASVLQLLWDTQSDPSKKNVPPFLSQNQTQQQNRKGFFWPIIPFWKHCSISVCVSSKKKQFIKHFPPSSAPLNFKNRHVNKKRIGSFFLEKLQEGKSAKIDQNKILLFPCYVS